MRKFIPQPSRILSRLEIQPTSPFCDRYPCPVRRARALPHLCRPNGRIRSAPLPLIARPPLPRAFPRALFSRTRFFARPRSRAFSAFSRERVDISARAYYNY